MKPVTRTIQFIFLMVVSMSVSALADTITLTAQTDRPVMLAGEKQTAYLRIGLRGCPAETLHERTAVNVAIVIDKSGSMSGEKIEKAKEAAILALHRLRSSDIVSIVLYDSDVEILVPATKMTKRDEIIRKIRQIESGGSTALYAGVQNGAAELRKFLSKNHVNRIILLSDGLANVGPQSPYQLGKLGADLVDEGISVTTIGLGLGYNEDLMSQLAFRSDGGHYFAEHADQLAGVFSQEFGRVTSAVAQQVHIEIICGEQMRPVRILGREGNIEGRSAIVDIQNIYSSHEKYILLEVEVPAHNKGRGRELAHVKINYHDMKTNSHQKENVSCNIRFTDSKEHFDKNFNKSVFADAVEQIAIENNKRALELRDQNKIGEAKKVLIDNSKYLYQYADKLESEKLGTYAAQNDKDAESLDEENWTKQRKVMREEQSSRQTQR